MSLRYRSLAVLALFGLIGCGDDNGGTAPTTPSLAAASGNAQTAEPGEALGDPVVVRLTRDGSGVSGSTVTWAVTAGGGSVNPTSTTTGSDGTASTTWTLGPSEGGNVLQASVAGASGSPVTFTATAELAAAPATAAVTVDNNFFDPSSARVAAGGTVTWTWAGGVTHNVTFPAGSSSGDRSSGTFVRTFGTAGSFDYQCTIHAGMNGTIVVE